jgi:hypothetical protein
LEWRSRQALGGAVHWGKEEITTVISRKTIVCKVCRSEFLGGVLLCGHAEPPVEHGQGARSRIEVRAANPAALTPGGEHPIERARSYVRLSLTYEVTAVTTSSGAQAYISPPEP